MCPCLAWDKVGSRVARWYIFRPKIVIWINFGGPCNGRCYYILLVYGLLIHFMTIWYVLWQIGVFSPCWYIVPRKIWQPWFFRENKFCRFVLPCLLQSVDAVASLSPSEAVDTVA
jgi:hypothetical protein